MQNSKRKGLLMSNLIRISICLSVLIILGGCASSTGSQYKRANRNANFHLVVSNQSFDKPKAHISIAIDGEILISDVFHVKDQHHQVNYWFKLEPGSHSIKAFTDNDSIIIEKQFEVTNKKRYASLSFWGDKLIFKIRDEPFLIL